MKGRFNGATVLVTGGAGFIGSHLTDRLLREGSRVIVIDNLSSGSIENVSVHKQNGDFAFVKTNILQKRELIKCVRNVDVVFHLAASPDTRIGATDTERDYKQNLFGTRMLLEAMRETGTRQIVFASSSTVYGDAKIIPTSESYAPSPISLYAASKLACEAFISAYCHLFGLSATVLRLANIVGPRTTHGVVYDFYTKLRENPRRLEMLGDGRQKKSYLYVDDCVKAFLKALPRRESEMETYNVGSEDQVDVRGIAKIVSGEMGLPRIELIAKSSISDGRGWKGDVKEMLLDASKMRGRGWTPLHSSEEAVRLTTKALVSGNRQGLP